MDAQRFWVGVASAEHVSRGVAGGFCQLSHGRAEPVPRLSPGDGLAYYAPREGMGEGAPVRAFVAIGTVAEGAPYEATMGVGAATRRDVAWRADARRAPIAPLLDRLSFTRGRSNWGMAFRRGSFEVTEGDFTVIAEAMGMGPAEPRGA